MSAHFGSLPQWLAYQQATHARSVDLSLERVRTVAERLNLLAWDCPVATVGGTNGKGSTASTLAALLHAGGLTVGLFTSPHLLSYNERVQLNGVPVSDQTLMSAFEAIEAARGAITLTFFEYNALAALQVFRSASVQAVVLEVGLGGRLDATNIIDADVAVLCSIGLDHRDWLGDTLELIGAEKAGIFRRSQTVVLGSPEMPESVWRTARALDCRVWCARREFDWRIHGSGYRSDSWDYRLGERWLTDLPAPNLAGAIQYDNAATALTALECLPLDMRVDAVTTRRALRSVQLPGRFQLVPGEVEWILDVAHNPPAAAVLAAALAARPVRGRTLGVAGMLSDKDVAAVALALDGAIDHWVLAGISDEPRGLTAPALRERLPSLRGAVETYESVQSACGHARALARAGDRIVVLGSFHVVGPALAWLGLYSCANGKPP